MDENKTFGLIAGSCVLFLLFFQMASRWSLGIVVLFGTLAFTGGWLIERIWLSQNRISQAFLVKGYALSGSMMVTSAGLFLFPKAMSNSPHAGGLGVAIGILSGYAIHIIGHRTSHRASLEKYPPSLIEMTTHTVSAGAFLGLLYGQLPELSILFGVSLLAHKTPAAYALSQRLSEKSHSHKLILLPILGLLIVALVASFLTPTSSVNTLIFGIASGVFIHAAVDFLPYCEPSGSVHQKIQETEDEHNTLDTLREQSILMTIIGVVIVYVFWLIAQGAV